MQVFNLILDHLDIPIYIAMAALFAAGVWLCTLPLMQVKKALAKGRWQMSVRGEDGSYAYAYPDFLKSPLLDEYWSRFLRNLALMRKNNAVCDVEDFINEDTALLEPSHAAFGAMVPGLLTTLGILGSFYGIVMGLSKLDLATTQTMSDSIAVLIGGMRTAFNTSIVGALLAVIFQIVRRAILSGAERELRIFIQTCRSQITEQLTEETAMMRALHSILDELRKMNELRRTNERRQ